MQMHTVPVPNRPPNRNGPQPRSYNVLDLAYQYDFLDAENGGYGQAIAILSLGGALNRDELDRYCAGLEIPVPEVSEIQVDVEPPQLGAVVEEDVDVALDIQVIAALVPCAPSSSTTPITRLRGSATAVGCGSAIWSTVSPGVGGPHEGGPPREPPQRCVLPV